MATLTTFRFFSDTNFAIFMSDVDLMEVPIEGSDSENLWVRIIEPTGDVREMATDLGGFVEKEEPAEMEDEDDEEK
jgi:hypothetical protein